MKGGHPSVSGRGCISEELQTHLNLSQWRDSNLTISIPFGDVTTETVWFDQWLGSLTMDTYFGIGGIVGIHVKGSSGTYTVGRCTSPTQTTLTLSAPDEFLAEVDVYARPRYLRVSLMPPSNRGHSSSC